MRGFIYILSNPSLPGLLKIGKTSKDPKTRGDELYVTGTPEPFKLEYMAFSDDMDSLERMVHKKLDSYRPNKDREFFKVSKVVALKTIHTESQNLGGLRFEERNFRSADDFWQLAQFLFQENASNKKISEASNIKFKRKFMRVQKPILNKSISIIPPHSRYINDDEKMLHEETSEGFYWTIMNYDVRFGDAGRVRKLTESQFEKEINTNFSFEFSDGPDFPWVLGYSNPVDFRAWDDNEPYYCWQEQEIISFKEYERRIQTKTTRRDIASQKKEEEKQRILREKEFKKAETQKMVESKRRNERILSWIFWFMIFSGLSLWLAPGGF